MTKYIFAILFLFFINGCIAEKEDSNNVNSSNSSSQENSEQESADESEQENVEEKKSPTAVITTSSKNIAIGESITFDASKSSDLDGSIVSYEWKEGSTLLSTQIKFVKNDFTTGNYSISLTVKDDDGNIDSSTTLITVKAPSTSQVKLKKSGQTISYVAYDDGDYQLGYSDFVKSGDVVIDNISNLMWQDDEGVKNIATNWEDAKEYCNNLELKGYNDWRLPSREELFSLVDFGKSGYTLHSAFVNYKYPGYYWSSTERTGNTSNAWVVYFATGIQSIDSKGIIHSVRCLRDNK